MKLSYLFSKTVAFLLCVVFLLTTLVVPMNASSDGPFPVSQYDYQFLDEDGNEDVGGLLASVTGTVNGYIIIINSLEKQKKYDVAVERLLDQTIPKSMPIELFTAYKKVLEAKKSNSQIDIDLAVRDNLGALIIAASKNAAGHKAIESAKLLETEGKYLDAANVLKTQFQNTPDAMILAYQGYLKFKAAESGELQPVQNDHGILKLSKVQVYNGAIADMEAAYALVPSNRMVYTWLGELYKTSGITETRVFVDGKKISFDVNPVSIKGRTFVPFRTLAEGMGAEVSWNAANKAITMVKGSQQIDLTIGRTTAIVDGKEVTLDAVPRIIRGRTMVPLRFIGEGFNASVNYDQTYNTIRITAQ